MSAELSFSRLVPGADGGSRFEPVSIPVTLEQFAPPAQPFSVSPLSPATQCGFLQVPAGWVGEMHPSPRVCCYSCGVKGDYCDREACMMSCCGSRYVCPPCACRAEG